MIRPIALAVLLYALPAQAQETVQIPTVIVRPDRPSTLRSTLAERAAQAMDTYDDISAARSLLKPLADAGDAEAARRIAETYDPVWLVKRHVIGVDGLADPDRAIHWYRVAAELGDRTEGNRYLAGLGK